MTLTGLESMLLNTITDPQKKNFPVFTENHLCYIDGHL